MTRNIVLLAPAGQIGFELRRSLAPLGRLNTLARADIDFSDHAGTIARVSALQPDVIVNAAAWTAVDQAETARDQAYALNARLPAALAQLANRRHCWLVHYSSDYVYPGAGVLPWSEEDTPAPLSVYGASKLAGDLAIQQHCAHHLIFRTSWVYAARGENFMRKMLQLAHQRNRLNVVPDRFGAPTPAGLIADVTALALRQVLPPAPAAGIGVADMSNQFSGIYHLASAGVTHWHQFACAIFCLARQAGVPLQLAENACHAIGTAQYPTAAKRPANSRLNLSRLEQTFGLQMPEWHEQLELTFAEWLAGSGLPA